MCDGAGMGGRRDPIGEIRRDLEEGGVLSELYQEFRAADRAKTIIQIVAAGRLSPEHRNHSLNDLIGEATLMSADPVLGGDPEERRKFEKLAQVYGYFRDNVPGVETYDDFLRKLKSGELNSKVVSLWIEEHMITSDHEAMSAVTEGRYRLTEGAARILSAEISRTRTAEALLEIAASAGLGKSTTGENDCALVDLVKSTLAAKPGVSSDGVDEPAEASIDLTARFAELTEVDAEEFKKLEVMRRREFPNETALAPEELEGAPLDDIRSDIREFARAGGHFIGVFSGGKLVGMIRTNPPEPRVRGLFADEGDNLSAVAIQNLYVATGARRAGIEQRLVEEAVRCAKKDGRADQIMTLVGGPFERLRKLFQQNDFRSIGMMEPNRAFKISGMLEIYAREIGS